MRSSVDRFPALAIRGETLELPGRGRRGPTREERRYASKLAEILDAHVRVREAAAYR